MYNSLIYIWTVQSGFCVREIILHWDLLDCWGTVCCNFEMAFFSLSHPIMLWSNITTRYRSALWCKPLMCKMTIRDGFAHKTWNKQVATSILHFAWHISIIKPMFINTAAPIALPQTCYNFPSLIQLLLYY
jgi:hypothetical protein